MVFAAPVGAADDKEPDTGGKRLTEWVAMLRESENGRLRRAVTNRTFDHPVTPKSSNWSSTSSEPSTTDGAC